MSCRFAGLPSRALTGVRLLVLRDLLRACLRSRIVPPPAPPSGPRSMTQSAVLMTSRLCSTTRTVLPASTKPCRTSSSFSTSAKCSPVVGSSRRYSVCPVDRLPSSPSQFDSLCLTAGQCWRRLPELQVSQPDGVQRFQEPQYLRDVLEELDRVGDVHVQDLGDVLVLELHLQRFEVEPPPLAHGARHPNVREEIHLQLRRPVALARLAPTFGHVETEPPRLVAAHL